MEIRRILFRNKKEYCEVITQNTTRGRALIDSLFPLCIECKLPLGKERYYVGIDSYMCGDCAIKDMEKE